MKAANCPDNSADKLSGQPRTGNPDNGQDNHPPLGGVRPSVPVQCSARRPNRQIETSQTAIHRLGAVSVIDGVLDLLADAIVADFTDRSRPDGWFPQGNEPSPASVGQPFGAVGGANRGV